MSWIYHQRTGRLERNGEVVGTGYSGNGIALNNPSREGERDHGPIPRGRYRIGPAYHNETKGVLTMNLIPDGHNARNRTLFRIHGDNSHVNHTASDGCVILSNPYRQRIAASPDHTLEVVE